MHLCIGRPLPVSGFLTCYQLPHLPFPSIVEPNSHEASTLLASLLLVIGPLHKEG